MKMMTMWAMLLLGTAACTHQVSGEGERPPAEPTVAGETEPSPPAANPSPSSPAPHQEAPTTAPTPTPQALTPPPQPAPTSSAPAPVPDDSLKENGFAAQNAWCACKITAQDYFEENKAGYYQTDLKACIGTVATSKECAADKSHDCILALDAPSTYCTIKALPPSCVYCVN
jgi:hypothetical protein